MNIGPRQVELLPIPPKKYLKSVVDEERTERNMLSSFGKKLHGSLSQEQRKIEQRALNQFVEKIVFNGELDG